MRGTAILIPPLAKGDEGGSNPYLPNIPFFRPPSTGFSPSQTDQSARMKSAPSITPRAVALDGDLGPPARAGTSARSARP